MSQSYESNTSNVGALFAQHLRAQHVNRTTLKRAKKATRTQGSTVIVRHDPSIVPEHVRPLSAW